MRVISLFLIILVFSVSCQSKKAGNLEKSEMKPVTVEMSVSGMHCMGCVETVRSSIAQLDGIDSVRVSLEQANAFVIFNPGKVDTVAIRKAVELNGYKITGVKKTGQ